MATAKMGPRARKRTSCRELTNDAKALLVPLRSARAALNNCRSKNRGVSNACSSEEKVVEIQKQIVTNAIRKADSKCPKDVPQTDLDIIASALW